VQERSISGKSAGGACCHCLRGIELVTLIKAVCCGRLMRKRGGAFSDSSYFFLYITGRQGNYMVDIIVLSYRSKPKAQKIVEGIIVNQNSKHDTWST
jgi:hypothetical protein